MSHAEQCAKVVAALKKRGYVCELCTDEGADFVVRRAGAVVFKLQVWGSLVFSHKNCGRENIRSAVCDGDAVYCYPHNETLEAFIKAGKVATSRSWQQHGYWFTTPPFSERYRTLLKDYKYGD